MKKTFLLGVGCQKGGTTWLHDHLSSLDEVDMGMVKEYHIFDTLTVPEFGDMQHALVRRANELLAGKPAPMESRYRVATLASFLMCPQNYFEYFERLAHRTPGITLTGDITPTYTGLPAEAFAQIREGILAQGFDIRVILLMRDPVDRCLSAVRMFHRDRGITPTQEKESKQLLGLHKNKKHLLRTQYEVTLRNLEAVFQPEELYVGFYEELFREDTIRDISQFLRVPYKTPDFGKQVNVSRNTLALDPTVAAKVARTYRDTYADVVERFGMARVGALWPNTASYLAD